ncbi:recombination regulator RecX [Pseudonocardia bannensis]|uniref:Regulatory protein RecX n=1 Tax=Pseudonocardia bannensis TaxID=630973 RepID=A0A848DJ11_9PSEU|nr:recombination regulator RecX [Pseudonocardia bannensis]
MAPADGRRRSRADTRRTAGPPRRTAAPRSESAAAPAAGEQGDPGDAPPEARPSSRRRQDGDEPDTGPATGGRRRRDRSGDSRSSGGRSSRARERPGDPASEPDQDADPESVARSICLRLLTDRARTRQELAQALRKRGVPDDVAARVLDRFGEVGLIDDAAFAGQWVHSRHTFRGLGRRAIAVELRRKGVDDETAADALAEVDTEAEEQRARELVERKLRTQRGEVDEAVARRLLGMLARKGYPAGVAYRVVKEALAEHAAELAEQMPSGEDG